MTFPDPPLVPGVVSVFAPALIATAGAVAALRRAPGQRRTLLLVGLALTAVVPALWWWSPWVDDTGALTETTGVWFGRDEAGYDALVRAQWIELFLTVAGLAGLAAIVAVAVAGLRPRTASAPPGQL